MFYMGHDPWPMQSIESTGISVALENDTVVQFTFLWKADLQPSLYGVTCMLREIGYNVVPLERIVLLGGV